MALILKVCKCVLQLVENLAFMSCVHLESICKCVLQLSCSLKAVCAFSELSVVPACTTRNYRCAVVPAFLWRNYRSSFGHPVVCFDRAVKTSGPKDLSDLSGPRGIADL